MGGARVHLGGSAAGAQPAVEHGQRSGAAAAGGGDGGGRTGGGRGQRRSVLDPSGGGACAAWGSASTLPFSLSARGRVADLRGRPARQEGVEEACARRATDRAVGGSRERSAGRGGARLLCGGAQRHHRRWPPTVGSCRAAAEGAAGEGCEQSGPGSGKKGVRRSSKNCAA